MRAMTGAAQEASHTLEPRLVKDYPTLRATLEIMFATRGALKPSFSPAEQL